MKIHRHLIRALAPFLFLLSVTPIFAQESLPIEAVCTKPDGRSIVIKEPRINNGPGYLKYRLSGFKDNAELSYNLSSTESVEIISRRIQRYKGGEFYLANIEPYSTNAFLQVRSNNGPVKLAGLDNNDKYKDIINVSNCQKIEFFFR